MDANMLLGKLSQLHLAEKSAICLEQTDPEYVLHMDSQSCERCGDGALLACTSSNRSVRLYKRNNLASVGTISGHEKTVTGVKFSRTSDDSVFTSSMDGTIQCWDLRSSYEKPVQVYEGYDEINKIFTAFDVSCDDRVICAGTEAKGEDTHLMFWDRRKGEPLGVYSESHQDDITQVSFHPSQGDSLATGSTDGLVCTFDISQPNEDDALLCTFNSESTVSQIGWCGREFKSVYCLTHIETFHIWETEDSDCLTEVTNVKELFKGSSSVDYLVDCFQQRDADWPVLVAGTHSGKLQLLGVEESRLSHSMTLDGAHTDDVRCLKWDNQTETLVTGGDDSMICLWTPGPCHSKKVATSRPNKSSSKVKAKIKKSVGKASKPY